MRKAYTKRFLLATSAIVWLAGLGLPAVAETPSDAWLDRLQAELTRAANVAVAEAASPLGPRSPASLSAAPEAIPVVNVVPRWQQRLPSDAWRLLGATLEAEGVPEQLLSVGWLESRFDPQAVSPKGARGIWQLMPATARRYGLAVSAERDDRTDLAQSTRAAARHLADLHRQFGDWLLALAAYNAGAERVEAAMARAGSRNFWKVRPWLPVETQNYVPAVLAAMDSMPATLTGGSGSSGSDSRPAGKRLFATLAPPDSNPPVRLGTD